ncbi:hypothetical protein TVH25_11850 [Rhodococcus sp. 7Tela_A2]|uniref:hypothetical protein n=1 Tax=Rhodococcus sp. 7Tela_A2 TaxID=3093744 RepID=UPI003BB4ACA5
MATVADLSGFGFQSSGYADPNSTTPWGTIKRSQQVRAAMATAGSRTTSCGGGNPDAIGLAVRLRIRVTDRAETILG